MSSEVNETDLVLRRVEWKEMMQMQIQHNGIPVKGVPECYSMMGGKVIMYPNPYIWDGFR